MKHYKEIDIQGIGAEQIELFIALLSEAGYTGFEENQNGEGLKAFIDAENFDQQLLEQILNSQYPVKEGHNAPAVPYTIQDIKEENWNALWESNFEPVVLDDFVVVRADFHKMPFNTTHEIVITPKMSFGTGHHATTYMMMDQMRQLSFEKRLVFDFGTGTGILAILAAKLGAKSVYAIDNDDWSIENAAENIKRNAITNINLKKGHTAATEGTYHVILANINKNVLIANAEMLVTALKKGGHLLMSGLLKEDEEDMLSLFKQLGLSHLYTVQRLQWICMGWQSKL